MAAKFRIMMLVPFVLGTGPSIAWAQVALMESLRQCATKTDSARRLACFDALTAKQQRSGSASEQLATPASDRAREFGLGAIELRRQHERAGLIDSPTMQREEARVVEVREMPYGRHEFTLDNGQLWQQTESELTATIRPGDAITITRGALGSFWIQAGRTVAVRATRIR
jgi:hypothetical protein